MPIDRDSLYAQIGKRIQRKRASLGITQSELAKQINLSRTSVANIEAGNQNAPIHVLYEMCVILHLRPAEVFPEIDGIRSSIVVGDSIAKELGGVAGDLLRGLVRSHNDEGEASESINAEDKS